MITTKTSHDVQQELPQVGASDEEMSHLQHFSLTRPDWDVVLLTQRLRGDGETGRADKYPRAHPYITGMQYVMRDLLRSYEDYWILDIGSPLVQNAALACVPEIHLTVLDVRGHDDADKMGLKWVEGTATALPFADRTWSTVTSLWVMGHVGDGRYGDELDIDGDRKMLREIHRVLAHGGIAYLGVGLVAEQAGMIFNLHRIYSWPWLRAEFDKVGFDILEEVNFDVYEEVFIHQDVDIRRIDGKYGLAKLRKR